MKPGNMEAADRLLGDGRVPSVPTDTYMVEYDHPAQKACIDWKGNIHIVDGADRLVCRALVGTVGACLFKGERPPRPCPSCFMSGDLSALRVSQVDSLEIAENSSRWDGVTVDVQDLRWFFDSMCIGDSAWQDFPVG